MEACWLGNLAPQLSPRVLLGPVDGTLSADPCASSLLNPEASWNYAPKESLPPGSPTKPNRRNHEENWHWFLHWTQSLLLWKVDLLCEISKVIGQTPPQAAIVAKRQRFREVEKLPFSLTRDGCIGIRLFNICLQKNCFKNRSILSHCITTQREKNHEAPSCFVGPPCSKWSFPSFSRKA